MLSHFSESGASPTPVRMSAASNAQPSAGKSLAPTVPSAGAIFGPGATSKTYNNSSATRYVKRAFW